ncbi:MAG: hydroxyacid dehydrogenase [Candidatus Bipolaricaulota bacterium]|nr:hydroxyacid dehydrogenase [Candidatus Bipolaricaulota bacterium]
MARILISDPLHPEAIAWLQHQPGAQVVVQPDITPDQLLRTISDYEALIVRSRTKVTKEVIAQAKRLRVIGRAGTGLDNIDVAAAHRANITVLNAPGANANAVAELTLGLMLALARDLPGAMSAAASGGTVKRYGMELAGKTLGLIGYGRIGRVVAHLAVAFGMRVLAHDIITPERVEPGVRLVPLETLISESDFVSLHIPLTPETRGFVNAQLLEKFKPGSFLINTARAEIVDESAILSALQSGRLRGYAADFVGANGRSPLLGHPRVVLTPHIGASTEEAQRRAGLEIVEKVWQAMGH